MVVRIVKNETVKKVLENAEKACQRISVRFKIASIQGRAFALVMQPSPALLQPGRQDHMQQRRKNLHKTYLPI
jgi:hypothetical protein